MSMPKIDEEDYCGYDDFHNSRDVTIRLPGDVLDAIEDASSDYPHLGFNGMCTMLMREGLSALGYSKIKPRE